jgi:hypothetical protein
VHSGRTDRERHETGLGAIGDQSQEHSASRRKLCAARELRLGGRKHPTNLRRARPRRALALCPVSRVDVITAAAYGEEDISLRCSRNYREGSALPSGGAGSSGRLPKMVMCGAVVGPYKVSSRTGNRRPLIPVTSTKTCSLVFLLSFFPSRHTSPFQCSKMNRALQPRQDPGESTFCQFTSGESEKETDMP